MEYSKCNNCQKDLIAEPWYSFQKKWGLADFGPGQSDMGVKSCQSCLKTVKDRDDLKGLICAVHEPHVYSQYFCQYCRDEKLGTDWDRYYAENHYHICEKRKKALEETPKPEREREREHFGLLQKAQYPVYYFKWQQSNNWV